LLSEAWFAGRENMMLIPNPSLGVPVIRCLCRAINK